MTGKKMPYQCVEVVIKLKHHLLDCLKERHQDDCDETSTSCFHLDIQIDVKSPGMSEEVELATPPIVIQIGWGLTVTRSYFMMALYADQSHFVHSEEVLESWRIVSDLLCVGDKCPIRTAPYIHKEGLWGPVHKVNQITKWDYPS